MYSIHAASQIKISYDSVPLKKLQTTLRNEKTKPIKTSHETLAFQKRNTVSIPNTGRQGVFGCLL